MSFSMSGLRPEQLLRSPDWVVSNSTNLKAHPCCYSGFNSHLQVIHLQQICQMGSTVQLGLNVYSRLLTGPQICTPLEVSKSLRVAKDEHAD